MSLHRIRVVIRRHAYVLWRAPHRWFDIAFWPLMDVILWGSLGAYVAQQNPSSKAAAPFLIGGILMFHVLFQSQIAVATGFMEETWSRNLLNVLTTPVTELEYIAGTAVFGIAKVALALTTLSVTAYVAFGFGIGEVGWSIVPIAAVLMIVGWGVGVANIGVVLRFGQGAEILIWGTNFILMALSGVFNPVDALPNGLQPIARVLPSTHAFTALREVLNGQPLPVDEIVIGLAGSVVFVICGFTFAWWMLRIFRRRGFVTRFS
jgi:ABC-2 type transport system permease protein